MRLNENAGEPKPAGVETNPAQPDEGGQVSAPNVAPKAEKAKPALAEPGGRFMLWSKVMNVMCISTLNQKPIHYRVLRVDLGSACPKPDPILKTPAGPVCAVGWSRFSFNLN